MAGVNFNDTTSKATTGEGSIVVIGPIVFAGTDGSIDTTYVDITDMDNESFNATVAGTYVFTLTASLYNSGVSYFDAAIQLLFDDVTAVECALRAERNLSGPSDSTFQYVVTLTAGSHTVRPQWKRTDGTGTMQSAVSLPWVLTAIGAG